MKKEAETAISLKILILNDLLRVNAIDKDMYDEAVKRILAEEKAA